MNTLSISRRQFTRLLGAGAAVAAFRPTLGLSQLPEPGAGMSDRIIRLSANENPYGPSRKAIEVMNGSYDLCCRYPDDHNDELIGALAKLNGVDADEILLGDGSGEILKSCADAFTGPTLGKIVVADPTFESIWQHAKVNGADVVKVPLTNSHGHDLAKMGAAAKNGLI